MNMRKYTRWFSIAGLIVMATMLSGCMACTTVPPGNVGIKVNLWGENRGVQDLEIVTGRVVYNAITEDVVVFPTHMQTVSWTRDVNEGNAIDESITFNSEEGTVINADVTVSFSISPEAVDDLYIEFRQVPGEIMDGYVRNRVRDILNAETSDMAVIDIYGEQKQELLDDVLARLRSEFDRRGVMFDSIGFVGALRLPPDVSRAIDQRIQAQQAAERAVSVTRQRQEEARQTAAQASGEAARIIIEAEAQAEANRVVSESLTPTLILWETIESWNGVTPQVLAVGEGGGGVIPMISGSDWESIPTAVLRDQERQARVAEAESGP